MSQRAPRCARTFVIMACKFCGEPAKATVSSTGIVTYTLNLNICRPATHAAESDTLSVLRAGRLRCTSNGPFPIGFAGARPPDVPPLRSAHAETRSQRVARPSQPRARFLERQACWRPGLERHKWCMVARAVHSRRLATPGPGAAHRRDCLFSFRPPRRITRAAPLQRVHAQTARIFTTRATWPPDVMPAKESAEAWERTVDLVVRRVTYSAAAGACAAVVLFRTPGTRRPFGCAASARIASSGR